MSHQKALQEFLIYTYFKIVPEEIYRKNTESDYKDDYSTYCIKKAIMKAYADATNEGAYNTLFQKELGDTLERLKEASQNAKKDSANFLLGQIQKLTEESNYELWHQNTCKGLCEKYSKVSHEMVGTFFTYGNAQKWVNMSMKYIWLLGLLPSNIPKTALHIPVDSYIIDALWEDKPIQFPLKENANRNYKYKKPSDHVEGWSKWNEEQYCNTLRKSISKTYTLEWENRKWIETAEMRKKSDFDAQYDSFWG